MDDNDILTAQIAMGVDDEAATKVTQTMTPAEAHRLLAEGRSIENVRIERFVFDGVYDKPVNFRSVVFVRPSFKAPIFKQEVTFIACTLDRLTVKKNATFEKWLTLSGSTLNKVQLQRITCVGDVKANNLVIKGRLLVGQCKFAGSINFWDSTFDGWVEFKECDFAQEFDCRSAHVKEGLVFDRCNFRGDVLLRGTSIAKQFDMKSSICEGCVDLSKAKLHDYAYLETIVSGPKQTFAFHNALGERILVHPEQIEGRLQSEEKGDYAAAMHEYAYLKRAFSALHRYEDEDWAFYRFKVNQRRAKPRSWMKPWTKLGEFCDWVFLDQGCGYGTSATRAVKTALVILLAFAILYGVFIDKFHVDKVPFADQAKDSFANLTVFALVTSVAVFTSGLSAIKDMAQDWMNIPLVIEALLGTLLWGLFIVAFSRKVIR